MSKTSLSVAFNNVFLRFDPDRTGYINSSDFINLIDELDMLQLGSASPILEEAHRVKAQEVVTASVPLSRHEVLEFLEQLGIQLSDEITTAGSALYRRAGHTTELLQHGKAEQWESLPGSVVKKQIMGTTDSLKFARSMEQSPLKRFVASDTTSSSPLAQSTPNRDYPRSFSRPGKENQRPISSPGKLLAESLHSAIGEGSFSPPTTSSSRSISGSQEVAANVNDLQDRLNMLQEREKVNDRALAAAEHDIQELEGQLKQSRSEQLNSTRTISELRSTCSAAELNIQSLEQKVDMAEREIGLLQEKQATLKSEIDLAREEQDRLTRVCKERADQLEKMDARLSATEAAMQDAYDEKESLLAQISGLEIQSDKLTYTESQLTEALRVSAEYKQQIRQLQADLDHMKSASAKSGRARHTAGSSLPARSDEITKVPEKTTEYTTGNAVSAVQEVPQQHSLATERDLVHGEASVPDSNHALIQQHYDILTNELGLQRNLIDTMIRMRPAVRKSKSHARTASTITSTTIALPQRPPPASNIWNWSRLCAIITLYSIFFLMFGFLIASQKSTTSTSGVSYAEMKIWERANSIEYLLDHHGVLGLSQYYRWWEGGWGWIEKIGYWIEEKLQDQPWPS